MAAIQIRWSSLFNLADIEFIPSAPHELKISDEINQSIAWLTGVTRHDRRLLRCNEQGGLLVGNSWDNLSEVETDELIAATDTPDSFVASEPNQGILVTTSDEMIKASFVKVSGVAAEVIYLAAETMYWYPHSTYSVTVYNVPADGGTDSYIGISTFN